MAVIESEGQKTDLTPQDYTPAGELKSSSAELALVVGAAQKAESYIQKNQWSLMWRDADLLFQAPRPMSVFENTYVLEPNVQRFTVAKVVNAITPQLYKGLFYADPPMLLRPRPGTHQSVIDAKSALFSYLLDECKFKPETNWGLEQMGTFGTGVWKWGVEYRKVKKRERKASVTAIPNGPEGAKTTEKLPTDEQPKVVTKERMAPRVFFEHIPLDRILVDSKCAVGDIRAADFAIDVRYMDFYQLKDIWTAIQEMDDDDPDKSNWTLPATLAQLQSWWHPPVSVDGSGALSTGQLAFVSGGVVHHSENQNIKVTPDLLFRKFEVLEYWDKGRKILVLDRSKVLYSGKNPFDMLPFLSANWWNRPRAFYGMGLGLIVGQNQRVDQGTINAILKILAFGVNPVYLRKRDNNAPTQMIRTGIGKILTVDTDVNDAYKLLESPKVPSDIWSALQESEKSTESSSGADQMLVQGSTSGPRTSMGRTASGAGILSSASATRLDGPLDHFIDQVFRPFLYILDMLVFLYMSDNEIMLILGDELGNDFEVDLQAFHDAQMEYEVLAGASLAAKRTMAQSMTLITQIFTNPNIQESLAEINGEYIDFKPILKMWMESSEWKNVQDIIKPLTPEMKQRMQNKSAAAQSQAKFAQTQQLNNQKFQQKQQLEDQATDGRIKRDLIRDAFRVNSTDEGVEGQPSIGGLEGMQPTVE